jgi:hypothetical protein
MVDISEMTEQEIREYLRIRRRETCYQQVLDAIRDGTVVEVRSSPTVLSNHRQYTVLVRD